MAIPGSRLVKFLAAGLPAFLLAVPLNCLLVDGAHLYAPLAYAMVLLLQVSANFFICRWLVFTERNARPIARQYAEFMGGILLVRLVDWSLYSVLVEFAGLFYIGVQIFNVALFALVKYRLSERIMAKKA